MRTTLRFKQLDKAIKIVDMLQEAYKRAEQSRSDLYHYDNSPNPYHPIKLYNTREQISERRIHWLTIAQRLEAYYTNTIQNLWVNEPATTA